MKLSRCTEQLQRENTHLCDNIADDSIAHIQLVHFSSLETLEGF